MDEHFKIVCPDCSVIVAQCRCPHSDMYIEYEQCNDCKKSLASQ